MMYDGDGWQLSPAFDLVPNIGMNLEHVLQIANSTVVANRTILLHEAKHFGIKRQKSAEQIVSTLYEVVSGWEKVFYGFAVPDRDMKIIGQDIDNRLAMLAL